MIHAIYVYRYKYIWQAKISKHQTINKYANAMYSSDAALEKMAEQMVTNPLHGYRTVSNAQDSRIMVPMVIGNDGLVVVVFCVACGVYIGAMVW